MLLKRILNLIKLGIMIFLVSCGSEVAEEEIVEESKSMPKSNFKFKSYKRITPLQTLERNQLERRSNVQEKGRSLLKTFDKNKSKINSSSQE